MELESNRLISFTATRSRRFGLPSHGAWPLSSSTHPHLTPAQLAKAGWFFTPSKSSPDQVTCFLCKKSLGGWEETDDPFVEHVGHGKDCGWAATRCTLELKRQEKGDKAGAGVKWSLEGDGGKEMEKGRKATFGKWWPHDKSKGWMPTSSAMAKAGFIFTPTAEAPDLATCLYCELGLDGWEAPDDPYQEHLRRTPKCPFFLHAHASAPPLSGASTSTTPTTKASKSKKLKKAAPPSAVVSDAEDEKEDDFEIVEMPSPPKSAPKTPGARNSRASKAASASTTTTTAGRATSSRTRTTTAPTPASSTSTSTTTAKSKPSKKDKPFPASPTTAPAASTPESEELISMDEPEPAAREPPPPPAAPPIKPTSKARKSTKPAKSKAVPAPAAVVPPPAPPALDVEDGEDDLNILDSDAPREEDEQKEEKEAVMEVVKPAKKGKTTTAAPKEKKTKKVAKQPVPAPDEEEEQVAPLSRVLSPVDDNTAPRQRESSKSSGLTSLPSSIAKPLAALPSHPFSPPPTHSSTFARAAPLSPVNVQAGSTTPSRLPIRSKFGSPHPPAPVSLGQAATSTLARPPSRTAAPAPPHSHQETSSHDVFSLPAQQQPPTPRPQSANSSRQPSTSSSKLSSKRPLVGQPKEMPSPSSDVHPDESSDGHISFNESEAVDDDDFPPESEDAGLSVQAWIEQAFRRRADALAEENEVAKQELIEKALEIRRLIEEESCEDDSEGE